MHERMTNKNETPTIEDLLAHIGSGKESFESINDFLVNELNAERAIKFDGHSQCWDVVYRRKRDYICNVIAEKEAFTFVTRLAEENVQKLIDSVSVYTKECIDNSPFRHRGWIEYRVIDLKHLDDAKTMLRIRTSGKQKSIG